MLISCPDCPKIYKVPASAIPPGGRDVTCSSCGSVWFESGVEAEVLDHTPSLQPLDERPEEFDVKRAAQIIDAIFDRYVEAEEEAPLEAPIEVPVLEVAAPRRPALAPPRPDVIDHQRLTVQPAPIPGAGTVVALTPSPARPFLPEDHVESEPRLPAIRRSSVLGFRRFWQSCSVLWRGLGGKKPPEVPPGERAAAEYRARQRRRARNRLTPSRIVGWAVWAGAAASVCFVVIGQRAYLERVWPAVGNAYALFIKDPSVDLVSVTATSTRFAHSTHGPVLEVRGVIINDAPEPVIPEFELLAEGQSGTVPIAVSISREPVPQGGERPFVFRAQLPEGAERAELRLARNEGTLQPGFTLQRTGSGWGQSLPETSHNPSLEF